MSSRPGDPSRWLDLACDAVAGRRFVLVGIGLEPLRVVERLGAEVVAAISVTPAGSPPLPAERAFPVLDLKAPTRNIFDLVVDQLASTLERERPAIEALLASADPGARATVLASLPCPSAPFGDRPRWAQDAALSRRLEHRVEGLRLLDEILPTPPRVRAGWPISLEHWQRASRTLGSERLVVQDAGLSGGGAGTRMCSDARAALRAFEGPRAAPREVVLSPRLDGAPGNVMGAVLDAERVLALPPSRQLVRLRGSGEPVYAGNRFGGVFEPEEADAIAEEARSCGRRLAALGFRGPFGLDFLRLDGQRRVYHDLNPRMNGAMDNLGLLFEQELAAPGPDAERFDARGAGAPGDGPRPVEPRPVEPRFVEPLRTLLLARREWTAEQAVELERDLREATERRPMARFFLSRTVDGPTEVVAPLAAGWWRVAEGEPLRVRPEGGSASIAAPGGDRLLVRPLAPPGAACRAGDLLVLCDAYCQAALADRLERRFGAALHDLLFDALADGLLA